MGVGEVRGIGIGAGAWFRDAGFKGGDWKPAGGGDATMEGDPRGGADGGELEVDWDTYDTGEPLDPCEGAGGGMFPVAVGGGVKEILGSRVFPATLM